MAVNRPTQLSEHTPPPFRPHTPDPEHESKIVHHSPATRAEHAMRQILFGEAKVKKNAADERVHALQQRDEEFHARATTPSDSPNVKQAWTNYDQKSPSTEACEADTTNQNGFGDDKQYRWPDTGARRGSSARSEQKQ
ncbi:hypothetical protein LTR70_008960 [Exophiala xenobiotica]|uniref:Uncharacterized protein n=1 Tax=Lithohypha guttulata TaxID=1690604 RepID=A0ABR0JZA4_9EURO|nr:hypothetical protein LTR24_008696 [Lithohypha guttulata]KAK5311197.1 hypothetical protein LTR70_008960 [Exophiala xenobiotica]